MAMRRRWTLGHRRNRAGNERGQAMAEFAIVLPVLMVVVIGMLQFGRVLFYWIEANHLANEAARWAVVDRNPYSPSQTLQQQAQTSSTLEFSNASICIDFPSKTFTTAEVGDAVRVRVQKPFTVLPLFGGTIDIKGSATMRIERLGNGLDPTAYSDADNLGTCT